MKLWMQKFYSHEDLHSREAFFAHQQSNLPEKELFNSSIGSAMYTFFSLVTKEDILKLGEIFPDYEGHYERLSEALSKEKQLLLSFALARCYDVGDLRSWSLWITSRAQFEVRLRLCSEHGLISSEQKMFSCLARVWGDVANDLVSDPPSQVLRYAYELGEKYGVNTDRLLTVLGILWIAECVVSSVDASGSHVEHVLAFPKEEARIFPERHQEDVLRSARKKRDALREKRDRYGLGYDEWFVKLQTPHGKERGDVVALLERWIRKEETLEDRQKIGDLYANMLDVRVDKYRATL